MEWREVFSDKPNENSRPFDLVIQALILVSIIAFTLSTIPDLTEQQYQILRIIDIIVIVIFTAEYILRLIFSPKGIGYAFSFWGVIDLLALVPFYLSFGVDLKPLRATRFFRVFMMLKLFKYNRAVHKLKAAFDDVKEELLLFLFLACMLMYFAAVGIYYCEHEAQPDKFGSVLDGLWWSVATITTVGYGDVYPITDGGRVFTFFILLLGLGIVAIPSGIIASALTRNKV